MVCKWGLVLPKLDSWFVNSLDLSFEQHCITWGECVQNYPIITSVEETRKGILYISVDSSDSFPPSHGFTKKETRRLCQPPFSPKSRVTPPPGSHGHSERSRDLCIPMYYLKMWRRQYAMFKTTAKYSQSTGGFVCVRFGGLSLGVVSVIGGFFVVVMSKLHKHGALPGRIWGR